MSPRLVGFRGISASRRSIHPRSLSVSRTCLKRREISLPEDEPEDEALTELAPKKPDGGEWLRRPGWPAVRSAWVGRRARDALPWRDPAGAGGARLELQGSIHFNGTGQSAPQIRVVPTSHRQASQKPRLNTQAWLGWLVEHPQSAYPYFFDRFYTKSEPKIPQPGRPPRGTHRS